MSKAMILVWLFAAVFYFVIAGGVIYLLYTHAKNANDYGVFIAPAIVVVCILAAIMPEVRGYFRKGGP